MISVELNNLEAEMKRTGIKRKDIAEAINASYRTIHSKFNGESQWLYAECVTIRDRFFPDMELGYLFPYVENKESGESED